jgi:hypothetical protein
MDQPDTEIKMKGEGCKENEKKKLWEERWLEIVII